MPSSKTSPKAIGLFVLLAVALVVVVAMQLKPELIPGALTESKLPAVGAYKVPILGLKPEERDAVDSDKSGRNIFAFGPPPTPTPDLRPTPTPRPTLPPPPPPPPTETPIGGRPKPAFTMSFMGWLGPDRLPVAVFRDGEAIIAVPEGEVLKKDFIVRKIDRVKQVVTIGFVGYPEVVTTQVPLAK